MALYAFTPIDLPPAPPAAPGTDFQALASAELAPLDGFDTALASGLADAGQSVSDGLLALAALGDDITAAALSLASMISEAEADDLTAFLLAAADQDSALESLAGDVVGGISVLPPNLLNSIFNTLIDSIMSTTLSMVEAEMNVMESEVISMVQAYLSGLMLPWYP